MKIYLDIDGTLIHEDLTKNYGQPAAGLTDFILALRPHDPYWLTTHCRDGNPKRARQILKSHLPESLHPEIDRIKGTVWDTLKTEAIDPSSDFIWFDNTVTDAERAVLEKIGDENKYVLEVDLRANSGQLIEITRDVLI